MQMVAPDFIRATLAANQLKSDIGPISFLSSGNSFDSESPFAKLRSTMGGYGLNYVEDRESTPIMQGWFGGGFAAGGTVGFRDLFDLNLGLDLGSAVADVSDWQGQRTAMQQFEASLTIGGVSLGIEVERTGPSLGKLGPWNVVPHIFDIEWSGQDVVFEIENKNIFRTGFSVNFSEAARQMVGYVNGKVGSFVNSIYRQGIPEANAPTTYLSEYIRRPDN